ncbi:MAG TPA: GvpL/GvpF family gas vesicle protein [Streptosporangiaceae bacterium]|nr:GvpL/GvpF family gas vesicle protein [Streptosporangiaceae bacterium]
MTSDSGWVWLYGVAGDGFEAVAGDVAGVGGRPPRTITAAGLTAIVGDVGDREYGEVVLPRNLEDLDWLARTARAHHAVLEAVTARDPVVPMRLATLFADDDGVIGMLRERAADLRRALSVVSARSEWGVKAYAAKPAEPAVAPASQATGPGAAYLQRRRAQLNASKDAREEALASAQAVYAELGRLAVSARLYPPQTPDLAGQPTPMVLNAAYLVANEQAGEFASAVTELATRHRFVQLTITGPWPAYSFVGEGERPGPR